VDDHGFIVDLAVQREFRGRGIAQELLSNAEYLGYKKVKAKPEGAEATPAGLGAIHKRNVQRALAEGKPVPPEVLADYPDLEKQFSALARLDNLIYDLMEAEIG
jgi:GNAT superfamily N-acetyltransferase